ncbi:MAG: hypothetical protein ACYCRH_11930 [Acidiferrobacteraceae bacterium]
MPSSYKTFEFLRAFDGVYETLDVRAAVIRDKDQWLLVALSVHVRMASSATAEQEFQESAQRFGTVDFPAFRIMQRCYAVADAKQFFQKIGNGELVLEDLKIRLSEPCDLLSLVANVRSDDQNILRHCWPRIEQYRQIAKDSIVEQLLVNDADILRDTEMAGYEYPHVAVKTLLGIDFSQSRKPGSAWIACDIPVRLLPPEVTRLGKEFHVKLKAEAHPAIQDVSCTIRRTGGGHTSSLLRQSVIQLSRFGEGKDPTLWSGEIQLVLEREDQVTLEVLSGKVGRLYWIGIRPFDLLPIEQTNPLLATLQMFCPPEQIGLLLQEPNRADRGLKRVNNPGRLFEVSVQWLLSILGFRAVWLHEYEGFKDAKIDYGTIDCIAYKENEELLLLVSCSLGAPDPGELNRQESLMNRLTKQLFPDPRVNVRAALFTTSHRPGEGQTNTPGSAVQVFFKENIDQLLRMAEAGQSFEYLRFISPASFLHLRS